jgi:hypothetical protein
MKNQTHFGVKFTMCIACFLFSNCSTNRLEQKRLLDRITATEDRLEILNLLAGSAFSSDVASEAYWKKMFTENAVFDRGQGLQDKGQTAILKIVNDPFQKKQAKRA